MPAEELKMEITPIIAYGLMLVTLGFFGYIGYKATNEKEVNVD